MSRKCFIIFGVIIVLISVLALLGGFVGFPVLFMLSIDVQRFFLFEPLIEPQERFSLVGSSLKGRNLYVNVNEDKNVTLGVWHFLPKHLYNDSALLNYSAILEKSDFPVLFHCHGNGWNRLHHLEVYSKLSDYFHVVAFDYRGYGDSSEAPLSEEGLVQDTVELYKWLLRQTSADVYVWGHSMGTAVATHVVARLKRDGIVPMGLILEAPYTTLREEALHYPLAKAMTWLPWFNSTMLDSLWKNGFRFETEVHILNVDCPIMILHAEDDDVIPPLLGEKLYHTASERRNLTFQGTVRFHLFPANLGYKHWAIYKSPHLEQYIQEHVNDSKVHRLRNYH